MSKYTDWYGMDQTPVRTGIYKVKFSGLKIAFSNWNGEYWGVVDGSADRANHFRHIKSISMYNCTVTGWRGLREEAR